MAEGSMHDTVARQTDNGTRSESGRSAQAQRIIDHCVARVAATDVHEEPFQHFYLEGILPDDVYWQALKLLPDRPVYMPLNLKRWKNAQGLSTRDRLSLTDADIERIDEKHRPFWRDIVTAICSEELRNAVLLKLKGDVAIRLGCAPDQVLGRPMFTNVLLVRDFEEYRLKPHPDGQPRVITMQIYLANVNTPEDLGTSLYVRQSLPLRLLGTKFREIKRFPFRPNSVYALAVNDCPERESLHGRETISGHAVVRDSIIVSWLSRPTDAFTANDSGY
jgi:hypothetical protein